MAVVHHGGRHLPANHQAIRRQVSRPLAHVDIERIVAPLDAHRFHQLAEDLGQLARLLRQGVVGSGQAPKRRSGAARGTGAQAAQAFGMGGSRFPLLGHPEIAVVAGKELVAAIAGEGDGQIFPRQLGDEVGRHLRAVGKGLVIEARQPRDELQRVLGRHCQLAVLGAQVLGDGAGMHRLVVALLLEADGEGLDRPVALRLHQGHDD